MIRPQKWQYWVRRRKPRASGDDPTHAGTAAFMIM